MAGRLAGRARKARSHRDPVEALELGRTARARIHVGAEDLQIYDPGSGRYVSPKGHFTLEVGTSSGDIHQRLRASR